ncbi:suppressor of fused domain protein [Mesorhizobium sp. M0119]|uniref:suppressor of fused domain protein n=1 Tax=unclassified Mesorhizobium TaxID=325217 RepID=UPI003337F9B4
MGEQLPSGAPIYRHKADDAGDWHAPLYAGRYIEEIEPFLGGFLGQQAGVFHEILSDKIHLDILIFPPNDKRNNWTFITSGMSDLPMNVPEGLHPRSDFEFAELFIVLPADWFKASEDGMVPEDQLKEEAKYWPIGLLKFLARLPHEYGSWVWASHTFVSAEPPEPYHSSTRLCASLLVDANICWISGSNTLRTKDGNKINFFCILPLYADELTIALNKGVDSLAPLLDRAGVNEVIAPNRSSVVPRKRFLGRF